MPLPNQEIDPVISPRTCVCGSPAIPSRFHDQFHGEKLLKCCTCQTLFVRSLPDEAELAKFYRGEYSIRRRNYASEPYFRVMHSRAEAQYQFLSRYIEPCGARILDFGCGHGILLDVLRGKGAVTHGFDHDPLCLERLQASGHGRIEFGDLEREHGGVWDVVCLSHLLEHLPDPLRFLGNIRRKTRSIFVEVPKYDSRFPEQFVDQEGHLWFFTHDGLVELLGAAGFSVSECQDAGPPMRLFWSQGPLTRRIRDFLRSMTEDLFFNMYHRTTSSGIWIRAMAKGG